MGRLVLANATVVDAERRHPPGTVRLCDGPAEFRHAVRDEVKRGADFVKLYATGGHLVRPAPWTIALEQTTATSRPAGTAGTFTPETIDEFEHMCAMLPRAVSAGVGIAVGDDFGNALAPHGEVCVDRRGMGRA